MASACVNTIGVDCAAANFPAYAWLNPRISFSREYTDGDSKLFSGQRPSPEKKPSDVFDLPDLAKDPGDFEFRLDDPVTMLPADELFSGGKLVPMPLSAVRPAVAAAPESDDGVKPLEPRKSFGGNESSDPYLFSPKAPRCTSRWREILGFRKLRLDTSSSSTSTAAASTSNAGKSMRRRFLHRSSKSFSAPSPSDSSLNLPLLKESDCESLAITSSRLSLSSSSSGHDHDDLPRLSLDADIKSSHSHTSLPRRKPKTAIPRTAPASTADYPQSRASRRRNQDPPTVARGVSVDSPRMSSSGKIFLQGLERSSSSPSSFNGGPRYKHRGMERSYSANVRVTPVLNVPVCSLRGSSKSGVFGLFSSSSQAQKKEGNSGSSKPNYHRQYNNSGKPRRESN